MTKPNLSPIMEAVALFVATEYEQTLACLWQEPVLDPKWITAATPRQYLLH